MTADQDQAKRTLRDQMKARLAAISPADAAAWSARVCARVIASEPFAKASMVMLFVPLAGEVDLRAVAAEARRLGKGVCLPKSDWAARRIVPAVGEIDQGLIAGRHGPMEPHADAALAPVPGIGLVLVPGLAFDLAGHRLGRGAGLYDRFLADPALKAVTCAAAFDTQIVDSVPVTARDIPIQWIATQSRLVATKAPRPHNT